ncbi:tripartite tricarboxylate transporter substrate binding protein [Alteribacillus iranensis]|uniref:Tripartite-type tricarboxylate transporter, receptor component TctC n=1 Tax=Alteribacillus iranensis TaxID=930128 RepID=A0A1I2BF35_9BACI|nr:tripartite tricarboxylate transporter substrate binding protein [Alteribacillus iranensis]SFE54669.1 Tripartite-type tricarboxylate transporter, receptor component TctC [Alteribacillus iranensis]
MNKKWFTSGILAGSLAVLAACGGGEENSNSSNAESDNSWPDEELTLVVPYSVGGSADRQARALAPILEEELDTSVVVENREGGGGASGTNAHKQNDPEDGTHIIYQSHPHFEAGIVREAGYEFEDFDILGITHSSPITIWVDKDSEYETMEDLLVGIENNPGDLSYAMMSSSWSDISVKMIMDELGLEVRDVPYDGGGPMRTALMGGEVDFIASDIEGTLAGAGEDLRPLAIFSNEPYEHAADVPLINDVMEEMGEDAEFPAVSNRRFVQVKSQFQESHPERWETLEAAFESAVESEEFKQWGEDQSMYLGWIPSEEATESLSQTVEVIYDYQDLFQ